LQQGKFLCKKEKNFAKNKILQRQGVLCKYFTPALIQTLKLLKPAQHIDFSEFKIDAYYLKHVRTLSIFKRIHKAKTISTVRCQHHHELTNTFAEEWVKYITRVSHLAYNMRGVGLFARWPLFGEQENQVQVKDTKDPLKYLRYCPKIESLEIDAFGTNYLFSKTFMRFNQYPALKQLAIKAPVDAEEIDFTARRFQKLESLHLAFEPGYEPEFVLHNIQALSTLPKLKELSLHFQRDLISEGVDLALKKIAEKGLLKKLRLNFDFNLFSHENILKALQGFHQVTGFALIINLRDENFLPLIYESIKKMNQLESLQLKIGSNARFKESKDLEAISQFISTFEKLRHLKLEFESAGGPAEKKERIPSSFIPLLKPLFTKPIKLETFTLRANQLDPAETYPQIVNLFDDSAKTVQKLKIHLGDYCPAAKIKQQAIIDFIQSLENIRVLRLPGLNPGSQNYLDQVAETIYPLRYLRRFEIGKIQGKVKKVGVLSAVEKILKKKGLRRFNCFTSIDVDELPAGGLFGGGLLFGGAPVGGGAPVADDNEEKKSQGSPIDMKSVMEMNPYLQSAELKYIFALDFFKELGQWA